MSPIDTFNKYALIAVVLLCLLSTCNTCNTKKQVDVLQTKLDLIETADRLGTKLDINSLETSKRILYDQNAIVRTSVRPDDRMNDYDQQIKLLEKKLGK